MALKIKLLMRNSNLFIREYFVETSLTADLKILGLVTYDLNFYTSRKQ